MITKTTLKEIIIANEQFLETMPSVISREGIQLPESDIIRKTVVFYGVRRSGKTFILFDIYQKNKERTLYVDFEDERLKGFGVSDFERLREAFLELKPHLIGKELIFLLDEVQNVQDWEKFCRRATEREKIRVYVSGSSSKMMPFEIKTELRGRSWGIEILPFSFREYLTSKGINPEQRDLLFGSEKIRVLNYFAEYLKWGGFPEVCLAGSLFEKQKLLKEYLDAMFFRDLVERYDIKNVKLLEALMDRLFSGPATPFTLMSFYRQYKQSFPFSKDMLSQYYKHLLQSMLVFEIPILAESSYARTRNPVKIYLVDTGLARRITSENNGLLLENIVFLEFKRKGYELFYFKENGECDLMAKNKDNRFLPIQITFDINEKNREREINGILKGCKRAKLNQGHIITNDQEEVFKKDGIEVHLIPITKWLLGGLRPGNSE
jgi:predicted AAA+ superfamily ATPase